MSRQVALPIVYGDVKLDAGDRIDILAGNAIVVEVNPSMHWRRCIRHES